MSRPTGPRWAALSHSLLLDGLIAAAVYLMAVFGPLIHPETGSEPPTTTNALLGAVICGALVFRRWWPRTVLVAATAGMVAYIMLGGLRSPLMLATMLAVYTVALGSSRRVTVRVAVLVALVLSVAGILFGAKSWSSPEIVGLAAQSALAAAVGDAVRSRTAYVRAIKERAVRAEQTREDEARRRVMEERLRIARDLHDVLAHHIALINVQAGVAAHVLETDPGQARQALGHIRGAGRAALDELRTTVGLLRQPNAAEDLATEPAPGLERLPQLIASFEASGLPVEQHVDGEPRELPATVDLTAYRVVQEALTNVRKHSGGASAVLRLGYRPGGLSVEVSDDGVGGDIAAEGTGHGLLGMRERALAVGGTFAAGPGPAGGFRIRTLLPLPVPARGGRGPCA
ncbi:sensor histidine kinase [Actinomadura scrupuli]|uniref:sensor histidine kinase n=1 Tax=Actinomadura scrupuli TaxID=559629 RepID=UPI003D96A1B9